MTQRKHVLKFEAGETTCASEPGKFCHEFGTRKFGTIPICLRFSDEKGRPIELDDEAVAGACAVDDMTPTRTRRHRQRPEHTRCPRCHKLRTLWLRANEWSWGHKIACMNVPGEGKVCWICRIREVDPEWRPGMPIPEVPNGTKCSSREEAEHDD